MKALRKNILLIIVASVTLLSCKEDASFKPGYAGSFGELILVVPNSLWKSPLGDTLYQTIGAYKYGFPQDERQFNIIHVTPNKFKSVLKSHRNVCVVELDSNAVKPIVLEKSKWAKGQIVVRLSARSYESLLSIVQEYSPQVVDIFEKAEFNRHYLRNKKFGKKTINQEIADLRGFNITTIKDAYLEKNDAEVTWIRVEKERPVGGFKHQISQGILMFSLPYTSKMNFLDTVVYQTVDSVFQHHLFGPGEGQFMRLNFRYIKPQGNDVNFKNAFGREYRGLWRMQGNAMGGPMYLLAVLDEQKGRVIYAFAYVFAPQFEKREYMREMEGVVQSIDFSTVN